MHTKRYVLFSCYHSFFGKLGSAGNENECVQAVFDVFASLEEQEKFVFISADEIYVKPSIRFRAGHVLRKTKKRLLLRKLSLR